MPDPSKGEQLEAARRFDSLTYWNHDTAPRSNDEVLQILEWLALSKVLHGTTARSG